MRYFTLNINLGSNRFWVNREESQDLLLNGADYSIWTIIGKEGYELVEMEKPNLNFDNGNPFNITVTYHNLNEVRDYIIIFMEDGTPMFYYEAPTNVQIWNKKNEIVTVHYVLDKLSTYYVFTNALARSEIQTLFRLKFKNRPKLNPRINQKNSPNDYVVILNEIDYVPEQDQQTVQYKTYQDADGRTHYNGAITTIRTSFTADLGAPKQNRAFRINYSYFEAYLRSRGPSFIKDWRDLWDDDVDEAFALYDSEEWVHTKQIDKQDLVRKLTGTATTKFRMYQEGGTQKVELSFEWYLDIDDYDYLNVPDQVVCYLRTNARNSVTVWMNEDIIPPIEPATDESQNKFYIDYQEQPYYNRVLQNEEIELLPIEKKVYDHSEIYDYYFNKYWKEQFNWEKESIYRSPDTTQQENIHLLSLVPEEGQDVYQFVCPNIDAGENEPTTYDLTTVYRTMTDDIFKYKNGMYQYLVVMPSGICGETAITTGTIPENYKMANHNIWYLIPIVQKDGSGTDGTIWGNGNTMTKLKQIPTIGAKASVVKYFSLPIPPTYLAMVNKDILKSIWNKWDISSQTGYWGAFNYRYKRGSDFLNDNVGIIPIEPRTLKIILNNNEFMNRTQNFLKRCNDFMYKLPTTNENEPFLYSPSCLNMCILPQSNNQVTNLGNDYLDLKYTLNNIGIELLPLNNGTMNYSANRLTDTRMISNARNELAFDSGLDLPMDTNAYTDFLNTQATTEMTSYKVLSNNQNLLQQQIGLNILSNLMPSSNPIGWLTNLIGLPLDVASQTLSGQTKLQNERLKLESSYNNIRVSSGTNVSLPTYSASCYAGDSGLVIYTNFIRSDLIDDVARYRRCNGAPVNKVERFSDYDNRQRFNIIALDVNYNYSTIRKTLKEKVHNFLTEYGDVFINDYINNYLTGMRLWKYKEDEETFDPYLCEDNYENNIWDDK